MRAKSVVHTRQKKKKYFRLAKGYYATKKNRWRMTIQQLEKSLRYAYEGRKDKKGDYRQMWIMRLNAAAREEGLSYSRFIAGLKKANVSIDRKILADIAVRDAAAFKQLAELAKSQLTAAQK
ncbi:MAG TPA: 50S ribosomal protein L20 [Elusimicrobia bacterium]|nr:MAG: 50S ribosomal protein L20 [Elusimicrobia bacterium RIFOXYA12_FULL_49_49]OGS06168.1 MAG: 50S ribosomal protein L20 [Elusimicrobia bacterium RIFOXYA1_FULL_47_7]OGS11008.1 MAG: 50S ribosomal protein L20 [Elusimicrobia bacterium RIFOXYB1_FULL_48_9]OGS15155.1 MAG: 50S ribosomal protein L20 [Elusimicrobia bacterium RIFOXYA2_FULL_47_53]OGS29775.1 MAG: 50S ribosomal protein L20 [Elusimicrobia bacterium RIFOXYB2_FULL_46_23]HBU70257.1 50S ribosomal protein L20 [Elusimicrobiota bacterium]